MKVHTDLHVHTSLSLCAAPTSAPEIYYAPAREKGIDTICFTNHFWDDNVPGAPGWYAAQNFEHVVQLREQLKELPPDIKIRFGAETEFIGSRMCGVKGGICAVTPRVAKEFAFVLIPPDHFHMKDFLIPSSVANDDYAEIDEWFYSNFIEAAEVELGVPTGIAHPFVTMGFGEEDENNLRILQSFGHDRLAECFNVAKEHGKSIEINLSIFSHPMLLDEYRRIYSVAAECGCRFHFGSDAHDLGEFKGQEEAGPFADSCGFTEDDLTVIE